jgi:hypothetical protein
VVEWPHFPGTGLQVSQDPRKNRISHNGRTETIIFIPPGPGQNSLPAVNLFSGVDFKAIVPGGLEDIDAAGFHHGPDPDFG